MRSFAVKFILCLSLSTSGLLFFTNHVFAAGTLSSVKDTITTSRPSAASPLNATGTSGDVQLTIYNNGSRYFASDSAKIVRTSTAAQIGSPVTIASQSAILTSVYLTSGISAGAISQTDVLVSNVTAMHTVSFITASAIPASGKIVLTLPGSATSLASPSATTFDLNGLTSGNASANISYKLDGTRTCTFTVSASTITCTMDAGGTLAVGSAVTFLIGCTDASSNATSCTTQSPRLINPTKTNAAGTRDLWAINIQTQDASSVPLDTGKALIGTIESVEVKASVDNSFTFTITGGFAAGAAVNGGNTTGCTNTEVVGSGISTDTATLVDLGILTTSGVPNIQAQRINITTNGLGGYVLTATASGHLINDATGFWIADSTTPAVFPATAPWFGIHACGLDVNTSTWGADTTTTTRGGTAKYGWPTRTTAVTLATDSVGPVDTSITTGNGITTVEYAAAVDATVPAGAYKAYVTYVATPTF